MLHLRLLIVFGFVASGFASPLPQLSGAERKPNIVFILADDLTESSAALGRS